MVNYDYDEIVKPVRERMSKLVPINSMLDEVIFEEDTNFKRIVENNPERIKYLIAMYLCINPESYKVSTKAFEQCKYCPFGKEADDGSYTCNTTALINWLSKEVKE